MNQLDKQLLKMTLQKAKVDEPKIISLLQIHGVDMSLGTAGILYQMEILGLEGKFEIHAPSGLSALQKGMEFFILLDKKTGEEIDRIELTAIEIEIKTGEKAAIL